MKPIITNNFKKINNIVLFPHRLGQKKLGVEQTPRIIENYLHPIKNTFFDVACKGNLYKNLNYLHQTNKLIESPKINIGGDHSMAIGSVSSSIIKYPNLKLIWIDAHADINTYETSETKNYHGMPLSFLTNLDKYHEFNFIKNTIPLQNILYIGIRDLDSYEKYIIKKHNMNVLTVSDIRYSLQDSLKKITNFINRNPIHISLDVDSMDPSVLPCTGTPVYNGFYLNEIINIIHTLKKENIVNIDFTELNLVLGTIENSKTCLMNSLTILNELTDIHP